MPPLFPFSLDDQIQTVQREIEMREQVYPKLVQGGRMTERKADHELQCMRAVLTTLVKLRTEASPKPS